MRRSVREALVGFSLLAAVASAVGLSFWLRGITISSRNWRVQARFENAGGLAERSPVVFRGVMVGSVQSIRVTPQAVVAELEITDPTLILARPTYAEVGQASLLGGTAQVALVSLGKPVPTGTAGPHDPTCNNALVVCPRSQIPGQATPSLESVLGSMQRLLDDAERQKLVTDIATTVRTFDRAAKEASVFLKDGQLLVRNIDGSVRRVNPILANLDASSLHIRNLTAALDNPKTISELQSTVANAEKLTARWEAVGGDVKKLTSDEQFMNGLRSVAVGLGKFFDELYPGRAAARSR
ncbi:MAG: MCE family protein [Cyanobacteria bacterium REEB417]|nr:MCE family protein [Cyanobacteria bacterium REEB417]